MIFKTCSLCALFQTASNFTSSANSTSKRRLWQKLSMQPGRATSPQLVAPTMSQSSSAFPLGGIFAGFEALGTLPHWALKSNPVPSRLKSETIKNPASEGELRLIHAMRLDPLSIKRISYRFYQAGWEFARKRNIVSVLQFMPQMPRKQTYANASSRVSTALHHVPTRNHAYHFSPTCSNQKPITGSLPANTSFLPET